MLTLTLDPATYDRLHLVASALQKTDADTVAYLLDRLGDSRMPEPSPEPSPDPRGIEPIHVVYKGQRVDAEFDRGSQAVTIISGPLAGSFYEKPSPAARAVVELVSPDVNPHRNGWGFWIVTATGQTVQSIRKR